MPFLNADEIEKELSLDSMSAGRELIKRLSTLIDEGSSLIVESTLSGTSLRRTVQKARDRAYKVGIIYISLETEQLALKRINQRVMSGGHAIPPRDVIRRYRRSKNNFWNIYRQFAHDWYLCDNSESVFELVAFGEGDDYHYHVVNDYRLRAFLSGIS